MSETVVAKADVGFYPKEKIGMGQALKGQLILTTNRLIYARYTGGKYLTAKREDYGDRLEDGLRNEGSFAVPLDKITEARADKMWGTPYFKLRYLAPSGERAVSFVLVSAMNRMAAGGLIGLALAKSPYDVLAQTIEQLRANNARKTSTNPAPEYCLRCSRPVAPGEAFCTSCGSRTKT